MGKRDRIGNVQQEAWFARGCIGECSGSKARCIPYIPEPDGEIPVVTGAHPDFGSLVRVFREVVSEKGVV